MWSSGSCGQVNGIIAYKTPVSCIKSDSVYSMKRTLLTIGTLFIMMEVSKGILNMLMERAAMPMHFGIKSSRWMNNRRTGM